MFHRQILHTIYKNTNQSLNSSITLQSDNDLKFTALANSGYYIKIGILYHTSNSGGGIQYNILAPSITSPATSLFFTGQKTSGSNSSVPVVTSGSSTDNSTTTVPDTTPRMIFIEGVINIDTTGGDIILQWAQQISNGSDTVILKGSFLTYEQLY